MLTLRAASVLVVDDSATMRGIVSGMLRNLGAIHVDQASSGEEAITKIRTCDFTLIISDWNMAPMDGLSLLRAVIPRQKPRANRFIFMTSEGSWGRRTSARIDGADEFIAKPFQIGTLKEKDRQGPFSLLIDPRRRRSRETGGPQPPLPKVTASACASRVARWHGWC